MQALGPMNVEGWQARLLGVAGWLPEDLSSYSKAGRFYLRNLWDHWWRERAALDPYQLPPSSWHLGGLRPANHTIRRLVLLAHWLAAGNVASRLEMWLQTDCPKARLVSSLTELLNVAVPEFWKHHWTLRSPRQDRPCRLLGEARVTDLAVNVILPWLYARAESGRQTVLLQRIQARYFQWPAAQDNAVLKLARERLFGVAWRLKGAAQQQGVLQILRDFCDHAPATCEDCSFPDLVQSWPRERGEIPDS